MNMTNALGTISAIVTILLGLMVNVLQCSTNAAGASVCSATWLTPQLAGYAMMAFALLTIIAKALRPGGFLHSFFGSTAVVVAEEKAGPGTVTKAQVKSN